MKLLITALVVLALTGCTVENSLPLQKADFEYEIDTWGSNGEVYEFSPKSNPNMACILYLTDSALRPVMQCFEKKKENLTL